MPRSNPPTCGHPNNRFWIGGSITTISDLQSKDGEVFRRIKLRCDYGRARPSFPTFRVWGGLAARLAAMPTGHRVCLGGHVHTYVTTSAKGRKRATWSLDVDAILADGSSSLEKGAQCDSNAIVLRGKPLGSVRVRTNASTEPKVVVEVCCVAEDVHIDQPKVTAYRERADELLELSESERLHVAANVVTHYLPGKTFMPMSIVMSGRAGEM